MRCVGYVYLLVQAVFVRWQNLSLSLHLCLCTLSALRELTAPPRMRRASPLARSVLKLGGWTENTADGDKTAACNLTA